MKLTFTLLFAFAIIITNAQSPAFNINITNPDDNDTMVMPLNGVISAPLAPPPSPYDNIIDQLQDIGVKWIRNNDNYDDKLDMESMFRCTYADTVPSWNCSPFDENNYHFESSDSLYRAIKDNGFKLFFRLGGEKTSSLSYQNHVFQGPQDTVVENNLIQAMVKVVKHYDNFDDEPGQLEYLNLWTEWANSFFWERSQNEFIWFFTKAMDTLNRYFPNKKIGGPGFLVETNKVIEGNASMSNAAVRLLKSLYDHNVKIDFIGWHLWDFDPENFYRAGEQFRDLLDGKGDFSHVDWSGSGFFKDTKIICDAWGIPKRDEEGNSLPKALLYLYHNKEYGSAQLTADWIAMQHTNTELAFYYRAADVRSFPDSTSGPIGWTGLFYGNPELTYKPNAYAFKLWSRFQNEFPHKMKNDFPLLNADSSKLWVLSAKNNNDAYGIMVSNTGDKREKFNISILNNPPDLNKYNIYMHTVNDNDNGNTPRIVTGNNFKIDAHTVLFIRIIPKSVLSFEEKDISGIDIFPNPVSGYLTIKNIGNCKISIIDITGTPVIKLNNTSTNDLKLDLSKEVPGIYFLKIEKENKKLIFRKIIHL